MIQFKVCFGLFRSNLIGEEFMGNYGTIRGELWHYSGRKVA